MDPGSHKNTRVGQGGFGHRTRLPFWTRAKGASVEATGPHWAQRPTVTVLGGYGVPVPLVLILLAVSHFEDS
ncbi:hypothetical protein PanWU01x14_027980 [Parasponia andersonii]|uniref:Transmembrane protein n=1 Tax=Parasponia andersonii TaxID=3476 RepID=A0A2P5DV92_PARAD|nr:hypothetical protein PanWU01x14_027980 [Parasponia andersonii]